MNKLIFRKLSYDILSFFLLSSLAITSIVWVIQGVNLLDIVTEKGHAISVYFFYSLLNIPKIFSKLLIFTYFLTLFVILIRYEENNEILVFWTNGIKKISFINFIGKISIIFLLLQLLLKLSIVPTTQNLAQSYLKNSSLEFFPKLIEEKKFSNLLENLTIFVEEHDKDGILKGIYIKEQINDNEKKIILASKGRLAQNKNGFNFELQDGKITNINNNGTFNISFEETVYELSDFDTKTRKIKKLNETKSHFLFYCLYKFINERKNENIRCGEENTYMIKDVYEEVFKRVVNPIYIIVLSLVSSLIILKSKNNFIQRYNKIFLFFIGFVIILFSELSYKFVFLNTGVEIIFLFLPLIFVLFFYFFVIVKSKFNLRYL
mgnify:CR=1 FL=1|tara:strand:- start:1840 stop:2970 length:1131 start_codon:yes stop_codon:yes gene_type:complete